MILERRTDSVKKTASQATDNIVRLALAQQTEHGKQLANLGLNDFELSHLRGKITAGFNGDNMPDKTEFVIRNINTAIIIITDGKTKKYINIGTG